jgi:tRNA dimethylallyltransferase
MNPILITGPTASGKSGLALALAEERGGVVINADSMQVYRDLHVLTARPSALDEARVPHRLYGHVDGADAYSAGRFQREVAVAMSEAQSQGQVPIIVGGTGLYFKALLEGLSPIPAIPADVRAKWRAMADKHGSYALWSMLTTDDPEMAFRLDPNDTQRIVRAHEVKEATGRSLAQWQREPGVPVVDPEHCERLILMPERDEIYRRCDQRFDVMMTTGALDEVRALQRRDLDAALPVMRALGVRPLLQFSGGAVSLDDAVRDAKAETRQFVKRQLTWFKRNMITWNVIVLK